MALTKNDIIYEINNMDIYQRDYDIITELLENVSPQLFTRICEGVIEGDLYWSDFEKILSNTNYTDIVTNSLEKQDKLSAEITKYINFRRETNPDYEFNNEDSALGITTYYTEKEKDIEFFDKEYAAVQNNILYELTKINDSDNILAEACKIRLYNAIKNGDYMISSNMSDTEKINEQGYIYSNGNYYEYINRDDIFLFLEKYIIPVDYEHQVLNDFDRLYAARNGLNEEQMKKTKSLAINLRRKYFFSTSNDSATGGN